MYEDGVSIRQAWARGGRWLVLGLIGWWTVSWAGLALAQTGAQSPEDFLNDLAKLDSSYAPAGSADAGESVDLYTGSLGFVVTDVSLPGNSDLRVALSRRFSVGSPGDTDEDYAFADWQLEVPVITGVVAGDTPFHPNQSGWRYVPGTGSNAFDRCTHFGNMPTLSVGTNSPVDEFKPTEYWGGFDLNIPGSGSQRLLGRDAGNTHAPSVAIEGHSSFPVVTKNDWVAACLPNLATANGQPGEGFLVIAPDGRKFWFDWLVYRDMRTIDKPLGRMAFVSQNDPNPPEGGGDGSDSTNSPQSVPTANLPRLRALLYASKVEDRFGHWVKYTYGGNGAADDELTHIEADDGRQIDIHWTNGHIDTVTAQPQLGDDTDPDTNPRVWHYSYDSFNKSLTGVTLPDSSDWTYALSDLNHGGRSLGGAICQPPNYSNSTHGGGATLDGHVITPAGLKVEYEVTDTTRGHADTPTTCLYGAGATQQGGYYYGQPAYAETYFVWALTTRTESGPGVASRAWHYAYSDANGSWSNECSTACPHTTVWTTVTDPEGRFTKYTYSNVFDATEGQLKQVEYRNSASGSNVRSQVNQYAASDAGPWPASYGYPSTTSGVTRANEARAGSRTPTETRTTSEGGVDYTWSASAFDSWAEPTSVTRASTGSSGDSVTETLAYDNNTALWVLGQFKSRKVTAADSLSGADVGKIPESRTYHASDATLDMISRFGHTVATYTWYPTGNAAAGKLESVKDGNNHTTSYSNYDYGVPTTISYADGHSISLTPNDFGEVLDVTDELGHTTTVKRDDMGRITQKSFPTDTGYNWEPVNIAYDRTTTYEYGVENSTYAHWRVTRTQGRNKQVTVYDAALNPVLNSAIDSTLSAANGNVGHMTWHQYDSAGREIFASYPLDYATTLPGSPKGVITTYDVLGRVTGTVADAESSPDTGPTVTTTTTYNSGNQIDFKNGRGYHTITTFQAFDSPSYSQPIKVQFPSGITSTTVTRDSFGAPTEMKQTGSWDGGTLSVTHSFGYDTYHRLCKQVSPETGQTAYGYDAADNLKWTAEGLNDAVPTQCTISPPPNAKISRDYDNRDRLIKIDYPAGTADKHFQYYPDGRLQYATRDADSASPASTWTMSWFHRGLLKSETLAIDSHNFALDYDYDDEGNRKSVTYPAIGEVNYAPDGLGRATKAGSYATDLGYDPSGPLTQLDYGNGIHADWGYNTRTLLDSTVYSLGSDLTNRSLTYDENGNLKTIADTVQGSSCATSDTIFCNGFETTTYTGTGNWAFDYDDLDRLLEVTNPYVPDVFTYDPLGNIRTTSELGTFDYDSHNRIKKRTHGPVFNYLWSDRGTLTTDGERTFTWNRANELTADSQGGSFGYDANGWRMRKSRDGTLEYFVYNHAHQLMLRWNNTTQTETDFVYLGGKALARIEGGTTTYIQPDYHGSPLFETGANGTITRQPFYLGYGRTTVEGRSKIPGYTGAAMDVTTGHTYLGARYLYHKRFTSPDPAGLDPTTPTGLNRYAYGADDPVNNVDRLGTCAKNTSEADTPCPEPTEPPSPTPPSQPSRLPVVTVTAPEPKSIPENVVLPPVFKLPNYRSIFRTTWRRTLSRKIDYFVSNQLVKKISFKTIRINKVTGLVEKTPIAAGVYMMTYTSDLGGCDSNGNCEDEVLWRDQSFFDKYSNSGTMSDEAK